MVKDFTFKDLEFICSSEVWAPNKVRYVSNRVNINRTFPGQSLVNLYIKGSGLTTPVGTALSLGLVSTK